MDRHSMSENESVVVPSKEEESASHQDLPSSYDDSQNEEWPAMRRLREAFPSEGSYRSAARRSKRSTGMM